MGDLGRARAYWAPAGTELPTDATSPIEPPWTDIGTGHLLHGDGLVAEPPSDDVIAIKAWGRSAPVRLVQTSGVHDRRPVIDGEVIHVADYVDGDGYIGTSPLLLFPARRAQLERCEGVEIVDNGDGTSTVYSGGVPLARVVAVDGRAVVDAYTGRPKDPTLPVYRDGSAPPPFRNRAARRAAKRKGSAGG